MQLSQEDINEYYDLMSAEQQNFTELNGLQPAIDTHQQLAANLSTPSSVGEHRLMRWLFAVAVAKLKGYVDTLFATQRVGTLPWYKQLVLAFQFGYDLEEVDGRYVYPVVDADAKIIKYANTSVRTYFLAKVLVIKAAKDDGNGNPEPLNATELAAFNEYIDRQAPMVSYLVISAVADVLKYGAEIFYDPLVLAPDGSLLTNPAVFPVHDAITNYAKYLSSGTYIDFDGKLQLNKLEQAVLNVNGVVNLETTECKVKVGSNPYQDVFTMPGVEYRPYAGYIAISTASGETLDDLLTFTPAS